MSILSKESELYDSNISIVSQSDECIVYKMVGDDGEGTMTGYQVFPGVELFYNDFRMGNCYETKSACADIMEINHCRQGRFECEFYDGSYVYLEERDLSVNMLNNRIKGSCFPLESYYGISIVIDIPEATQSISSVLKNISIDLYGLRDKLCADNGCFIMRAKDSVEHIFSELYTVPNEIKQGYFKLKVLELLLFLSGIDISESCHGRQYFHKCQVEVVKAMKEYMTDNLECHNTLEELSDRFGIPLIAMKTCFKGVYGNSVFAFMRGYRMHTAALLLRQGNESVTSIASKVGYVNASKFAAAFKDEIGLSPLKYRKANGTDRSLLNH